MSVHSKVILDECFVVYWLCWWFRCRCVYDCIIVFRSPVAGHGRYSLHWKKSGREKGVGRGKQEEERKARMPPNIERLLAAEISYPNQ